MKALFGKLKNKIESQFAFVSGRIRHESATPLKFVNALGVYLQFKILRNARIIGYPFEITIDPCNFCNLSCPLCPTGMKDVKEPKGRMTFDQFRSIVDRLWKYLYDIELHNWGEPFLNRDILEMIRYARNKNISVRLSSNLCHLPKGWARELVKLGVACIFVSADGVTQDVYEIYRKGGELSKALENIKRLVRWKDELHSKTPDIVLNFISFRHNAHQR
ncbi:radical SAM protein, partial [Acidobacteriota bacterium]